MSSAERRKERLTLEALGEMDPTVHVAEKVLVRTIVIVVLVTFVVLFSGSYPT